MFLFNNFLTTDTKRFIFYNTTYKLEAWTFHYRTNLNTLGKWICAKTLLKNELITLTSQMQF